MAPSLHFGSFHFPTYFLIISLVCTAGVFVIPRWAEKFGQSEGMASQIYLLTLIAGLFGARLFHVVLEAPALYRENPLEIFAVWNGGFVFLGSVLFALGASWYWVRKQAEDFYLWADLFAPWMSLGYALGRVGCFLNGCCYGKECHLPWAVKFPSHMNVIFPFVQRHPTQIYAFLGDLFLFGVLLFWAWRKRSKLQAFKNTGMIFSAWLFGHGIFRFILEFFRDDDRGEIYFGWSVSSLISLLMIGCGFWGFIWRKKRAAFETA